MVRVGITPGPIEPSGLGPTGLWSELSCYRYSDVCRFVSPADMAPRLAVSYRFRERNE